MTVNDIIKISGGSMYKVVDATRQGYMTSPVIILVADRNVVGKECGDMEVVAMEAYKKNGLTLYVK